MRKLTDIRSIEGHEVKALPLYGETRRFGIGVYDLSGKRPIPVTEMWMDEPHAKGLVEALEANLTLQDVRISNGDVMKTWSLKGDGDFLHGNDDGPSVHHLWSATDEEDETHMHVRLHVWRNPAHSALHGFISPIVCVSCGVGRTHHESHMYPHAAGLLLEELKRVMSEGH